MTVEKEPAPSVSSTSKFPIDYAHGRMDYVGGQSGKD